MRTAPKTQSNRATLIRTQERMDQEYITNVTRNIMGELHITHEDLQEHPSPKDFSKHVFPGVLHHIKEWSSSTLGKIAAYGLGRGETSRNIPLRQTSLEDAWYGTPLEMRVSGGLALEWFATITIIATAYDLLMAHALVDHLKAKAAVGGENGYPVSEIFTCRAPYSKKEYRRAVDRSTQI